MNNVLLRDSILIEEFLKEAGDHLLSLYHSELKVISQEKRDIKLKADQDMELMIKGFLKKEFQAPILGEEFGESSSFKDLTGFVIDPIDGTMNFSRNLPIFCISIGFLSRGRPTYGAIYNPVLKELIVGGKSVPLRFNGEPFKPNLCITKSQAVLGTGVPTNLDLGDDESFNLYLSSIKRFKKVRMIGSAAQSTSWIAIGRLDAYMENSIMLWDVCAGLSIIEAAGGKTAMHSSPNGPKWSYNVKAAINDEIFSLLL